MAYADELSKQDLRSELLVVLKPRVEITTSWTNVSGTLYKTSFTRGRVAEVFSDGLLLAGGIPEGTDAASLFEEWFYDETAQELYLDILADPNTFIVVASYEIYTATFDTYLSRVPTDSSTTTVYWEPLVVRNPSIQKLLTEANFGFMPVSSSAIALSNVTGFWNEHILDASFKGTRADVYNYLTSTANIKLVQRSKTDNLTWSDAEINLTLKSDNDIFNNQYRNLSLTSTESVNFLVSSQFPDLDPAFLSNPKRSIFGLNEGVRLITTGFEADAPTTSDNRNWTAGVTGTSHSASILATGTNTTTRTHMSQSDAQAFNVDDGVTLNFATAEGAHVTAVNSASSPYYIDHTAWHLGSTGTTGFSVIRRGNANIRIKQPDSGIVLAIPERDYTSGPTFTSSAEANLGINTLRPSDIVYARVYGTTTAPTWYGGSFESNDPDYAIVTNGVSFLNSIMTRGLSLSDTDFDQTSWEAARDARTEVCNLMVPFARESKSSPSFRDVISQILQNLLLNLYINEDNKWALALIGPQATDDKTVDDSDIVDNTTRYSFDYSEVYSKIDIRYNKREVDEAAVPRSSGSFSSSSIEMDRAKLLYGIERTKQIESIHSLAADADTFRDRMSYIFGERRGLINFTLKHLGFDTEIQDQVKVERTRLPGFEFDADTVRSDSYNVLETNKNSRQITIKADDQKGIEDNSGSW